MNSQKPQVMGFIFMAALCLTSACSRPVANTATPIPPAPLGTSSQVEQPEEDLYWEDEEEDLGFMANEGRPKPFEMTSQFCQEWNPEFKFRGNQCCAKLNRRGKRHKRACSPQRRRSHFCDEVTDAQKSFTTGQLDALSLKGLDQQAFCTPDNGFIANGVPLLETPENRILIANPNRCANFGTTSLVLTLHQMGKTIHKHLKDSPLYSGARLVIGDMSAPKGGCLATPRGSHSGHTNGLDADVAFLEAQADKSASPRFHREMDVPLNWWFLRTLAADSPVCLQYIFLDRSHIRKLKKYALAQKDKTWYLLAPVFKHAAGHKNHFHIRIGTTPRQGGPVHCLSHKPKPEVDAQPE